MPLPISTPGRDSAFFDSNVTSLTLELSMDRELSDWAREANSG